ncbi:hypothetical protein [Rhizobium sp. P32RR-XVIII]|nr:hypothetical protein [Rhizobium sp. P32RR-XVIII]
MLLNESFAREWRRGIEIIGAIDRGALDLARYSISERPAEGNGMIVILP